MSGFAPRSDRDLLANRQAQFDASIEAGNIDPFVYPFDSFAAGLLILCLWIPTPRIVRYAAFACIIYLSTSTVRRCRSLGMAGGYGIGLACGWCILWSATMLIFNDVQKDFRRIEKWRMRPGGEELATAEQSNGIVSSGAPQGYESSEAGKNSDFRKRKSYQDANGTMESYEGANESAKSQDSPPTPTPDLLWQPYPRSIPHRLEWSLDLISNFRGPGWSWRISGLPPLPAPLQEQLRRSSSKNADPQEDLTTPVKPSANHQDIKQLLRSAAIQFATLYLIIDLLKVLMMHDPYFWGLPSPQQPPTYLPTLITQSSILTKSYRLILSLSGTIVALNFIFTLSPFFFAGILGHYFPNFTRIPFTEPFLYPRMQGPFTSVFDNGLAGWWGKWWQQMFRFGFSSPSRYLIHKLGWNHRDPKAKTLQLFVAFALSGSLHACASYTQFAPARPLTGPLAFFILQAIGTLAQTALVAALAKNGIVPQLPQWIKRVANLAFLILWFYFTGPLLVDDFARGGIWLFEPVPVSPLRGLGFGAEGEGWWCWHGKWVRFWRGERWWSSGLAIL